MKVTEAKPVPRKPNINIELEPHEASELLTFLRRCTGGYHNQPDCQAWEVTDDIVTNLSKLNVKEVNV